VLPFNHPLRIAGEIALLDLISDGRVDFGVRRGFQPIEYRSFQIDQTRSRAMFDEALDIILHGKCGLNLLCAPAFGFYRDTATKLINRYHDGLKLAPNPGEAGYRRFVYGLLWRD
jgi:alkanesulfonate monooxygenase SsuD/methylene tetrahydromethanopterin reductase-like flavin-dependent oxidoreductase (luciferase family)